MVCLEEIQMRMRSLVLLGVLVLVAGGAIAAVWTQVIPEYEAKAEVRVRTAIPRLVFQTEDNGMIPMYSSFVNTQVSIIRSLDVLQRVLDRKEVQETQWYKDPGQNLLQKLLRNQPDPPMERLRDILSVRPRRETEIIDVALAGSSAKDCKIIVDAVVDQYIRYISEKSYATRDGLNRQLVEQFKSLENEILGREKVSAELRRSLGTDSPQGLISARRIRLDEMQARVSEHKQRIALLEWQRKQVEGFMKRHVAEDNEGAPTARPGIIERDHKYYKDAEWRKLDVDVRTIRHNIEAADVDPNAPDMVRAQKDLEFAKELLQLRETQLDNERRDRLINADEIQIAAAVADGLSGEEALMLLNHQLEQSKKEEELLAAELKDQNRTFERLFTMAQILNNENNALAHKRELFTAVRQRLDQKNMERNVPGSIEVLTRAFAPSEPRSDRRIAYTAIVLALALALGGGTALFRGRRSRP